MSGFRTERLATSALALLAPVLSACTGSGASVCRLDADCQDGICGDDGFCTAADDLPGADGGPASPPDASAGACSPDRDGQITAAEMPLRAGLSARFRVATDAEVDTAGTSTGSSDTRSWNLDHDLAGDRDVDIVLDDPAGKWFSAEFPGASYVTELSAESDLIGVFRVTDSALQLLGVVSPEGGVLRTELRYEPPVDVVSFPIELGSSWISESTVSGWANGVLSVYSEDYRSAVDAAGDLATPFGSFPVLRVRTELTRTVGAAVVTSRTYLFVSECFGTVGTVVSRDYESEQEFDEASEVRRLSR